METIYDDYIYQITPTTIKYTDTPSRVFTYKVSDIKRVLPPFRDFTELMGVPIGIGLFVFGMWCIKHFTIGWFIIGLVVLALAWMLSQEAIRGRYVVSVSFKNSDDDLHINTVGKVNINKIYLAIVQAMKSQGITSSLG